MRFFLIDKVTDLVPGERVPANSGRFVAFRDGVALPPNQDAGAVAMAAAG